MTTRVCSTMKCAGFGQRRRVSPFHTRISSRSSRGERSAIDCIEVRGAIPGDCITTGSSVVERQSSSEVTECHSVQILSGGSRNRNSVWSECSI